MDDEARMRKLVKDFLAKSGYEVLEAEDGNQAVDVFFEHKDIALACDIIEGWGVGGGYAPAQLPAPQLLEAGPEVAPLGYLTGPLGYSPNIWMQKSRLGTNIGSPPPTLNKK